MKLLLKFNLILIVLIVAGLLAVSRIAHSFLIDNAKAQVMQQAELMMESASAMRTYTTEEIKPLLVQNPQFDVTFLPQTVPAYAATVTFARLRQNFPEYTYKEATLNPTNLQDRADDWESDIVEYFRNNPDAKEFSGERATPTGTSLFLAHPLAAGISCMECHSVPSAAPTSMLKKYGSSNGFGWKLHEVIAAQIVSVPANIPIQIATKAFGTLMWTLTASFAAILLAVNLALYFVIIAPVRRLSRVTDQVSLGKVTLLKYRCAERTKLRNLRGLSIAFLLPFPRLYGCWINCRHESSERSPGISSFHPLIQFHSRPDRTIPEDYCNCSMPASQGHLQSALHGLLIYV